VVCRQIFSHLWILLGRRCFAFIQREVENCGFKGLALLEGAITTASGLSHTDQDGQYLFKGRASRLPTRRERFFHSTEARSPDLGYTHTLDKQLNDRYV
jgi:hypothetical protein